ncbi:hypothetical protein M8J76_002322 [Diaphorina citri]|nr:hypothetical protein M8J76_002322 [Diaphorina citri]
MNPCARGSGFFELQILEIANYKGELASGICCGGLHRPDPSISCPVQCNTLFRVCLKEYQSNVTSNGPCSFGNTSSPVLGGNSFTLTDPDRANGNLVLPFTFRWTRSFTLILQALDLNNQTSPDITRVVHCVTLTADILMILSRSPQSSDIIMPPTFHLSSGHMEL